LALPSTANTGDWISFLDITLLGNNYITTSANIMGVSGNMRLDLPYSSGKLSWSGNVNVGWILIS
jgi:hypothetical protein